MEEQRKVITEMIQVYRDLPCLWDQKSQEYKDFNRKQLGWKSLLSIWKEIEPDANVVSVKKKIDHLKASYHREVKKVKDSKKRARTADDVHKPNLWYFKMLSFLEKNDKHSESDAYSSREESPRSHRIKKKRRHSLSERNKYKAIQTAHEPLRKTPQKTNSFGIYVGEQLDCLSTYQRQIAEKLISEVIFLAKTERLDLNSMVETQVNPSRHTVFLGHSSQRSPACQSNNTSPQYDSLSSCSPLIVVKAESSPQYDSSHSSAFSFQKSPSSCQSVQATEEVSASIEEPAGSMLKELLLSTNPKD